MTDAARRSAKRIRGTTVEVDAKARALRNNMTPAEQIVWPALRRRQVSGLRFRRQYPIGPFILDFVCPSIRLVVEVDGPVHDETVDYDQARTGQLQHYGYRVLRFRNDDIAGQLEDVLKRIRAAAAAQRRITPPPGLGEG